MAELLVEYGPAYSFDYRRHLFKLNAEAREAAIARKESDRLLSEVLLHRDLLLCVLLTWSFCTF